MSTRDYDDASYVLQECGATIDSRWRPVTDETNSGSIEWRYDYAADALADRDRLSADQERNVSPGHAIMFRVVRREDGAVIDYSHDTV